MELVGAARAILAASLLAAPQAAQDPNGGHVRLAPTPMRTATTRWLSSLELMDRSIDAYTKKPEGKGTWPGVVLLHDSMGLTFDMIKTVDHLAGEGFFVIAPDLYGGKIALDADKGRELSVLMDEQAALDIIEAVAAYLRTHPDVGDHRVGLVGFDTGGRVALREAMGSRDVSAIVVVCTRPGLDADDLRRIGCPILGLFGGKDEMVPASEAVAFRGALSAAGRTAEVKIFDEAGHGFMKESDPSYKTDLAKEAWTRMVAFLRENL